MDEVEVDQDKAIAENVKVDEEEFEQGDVVELTYVKSITLWMQFSEPLFVSQNA